MTMTSLKKSSMNGLVNFAEGVTKTTPVAGVVVASLGTAGGIVASFAGSGGVVAGVAGSVAFVAAVADVVVASGVSKKIQTLQSYMDYKPVKSLQRLGVAFGIAAPLALGGWAGVETFQYLNESAKKERAEKTVPHATYDMTGKPGTACNPKIVFEGADGTQFLLPKGCKMKPVLQNTNAPRPGE